MKLTKNQCELLRNANDKLRGTNDYNRYHMECTVRSESGKWLFCSWSAPRSNHLTVKTVRGVTYLYENDEFFPDCVYRYAVNDAVKKLLNL